MAKHEPWYKPRDEDGDDQLLDWLGGRQDPQPANQGSGCLRVAAPVAAAVTVLLGVLR